MKRSAVLIALCGAMLLATSGTALATEGDPQGPIKQEWTCVLDLGTWHCEPPGVEKNFDFATHPSAPSLNFECDDPSDCEGFAVSLTGPPAGTSFVGTENLLRQDLWEKGTPPCPRGNSGTVPGLPYHFCHHYGS